jgi:hypothetical protein
VPFLSDLLCVFSIVLPYFCVLLLQSHLTCFLFLYLYPILFYRLHAAPPVPAPHACEAQLDP